MVMTGSTQHIETINSLSESTCRSFNDKPVKESAVGPIGKELFEKEQDDLLSDLKDIPKKACDRRVSFFTVCVLLKSHSPVFSPTTNTLVYMYRSMNSSNVLGLPRYMLI